MSTRGNTIAAVASLGVLALGWTLTTGNAASQASNPGTTTAQTAAPTTEQTATQDGTATQNTDTNNDATNNETSNNDTDTGNTGTNSSGYTDGTYTGQTATHRFGSVTITVTISGGKITNLSENVVSDGDRKSDMINSRSVPVVREAVLSANSADVSTVSGATYTTRAYLESLQSALDQAKG